MAEDWAETQRKKWEAKIRQEERDLAAKTLLEEWPRNHMANWFERDVLAAKIRGGE